MSLDGDGMILRRREGTYKNNAFSQTTAEKGRDAVFTYGSGQQLAEQTRDGTKLDVFGLMGMRDAGPASKDQQKFINKQARKGNVMGAYDQIAQRYSVYGQDGASRVQVQSGDSLQGIAQRVYGNSSLWYVLAAANALAGDSELIAGTQLRVPEVGVSKNDASSFKPYNPNEIVGSTSPGLPYIPPASSLSCKQTLILIATTIVRVVAAFYGGVLGVMAVDALMQKVEINSGIRSEYSLGQTVASGIFAMFAPVIQSAGTVARIGWSALAAATAYTSSYLVDKSRGANVHFNWGNLAASVVTSMISTKLGAVGNTGVAAGGTVSAAVSGTAFSWAKVATDTMKNLAISVVNQGVTQLITGDKAHWDAGALFADSFGNALGSAVAQKLDQKFLSAAERKQLNAMPEDMKREYDALRAQGKSQQQAYDFVTNAGGLRAMGDQLIASFGAQAESEDNYDGPRYIEDVETPEQMAGFVQRFGKEAMTGELLASNHQSGYEFQKSVRSTDWLLPDLMSNRYEMNVALLLGKPYGGVFDTYADGGAEIRRFLNASETEDISAYSLNKANPGQPTHSAEPQYRFLPEGKVEPSVPRGHTRVGTIVISASFAEYFLEEIGYSIPDVTDLEIKSVVIAPDKRDVNPLNTKKGIAFETRVQDRAYERATRAQLNRSATTGHATDGFAMAIDLLHSGGVAYQKSKNVMQVDLYRNIETGKPVFEVTMFNFNIDPRTNLLSIKPFAVYTDKSFEYQQLIKPKK